jgi:hypothetical protein
VLLWLETNFMGSGGRVEEAIVLQGGSSVRTPREEIDRQYLKRWKDGRNRPNAPSEHTVQRLVEEADFEAVAAHFRNAYIARSKRDPKDVLD